MRALRARILAGPLLRQLGEAADPAGLAAQLEREEDWHPFLREAAEIEPDPALAIRSAIGRHRAERLGALPAWYEETARQLVEALVLPLDRECAVAVLRRRRAGVSAEAVLAAVAPGVLLRGERLGSLCGAPDPGAAIRMLARMKVLGRRTADDVARLSDGGAAWETVEQGLFDAFERARDARIAETGADGDLVRKILVDERAVRRVILAELSGAGPGTASDLERIARLQQLDRLARRALHDPLGVGVVAGYAAAVESQAIRLRAILAHVSSGRTRESLAGYLSSAAT